MNLIPGALALVVILVPLPAPAQTATDSFEESRQVLSDARRALVTDPAPVTSADPLRNGMLIGLAAGAGAGLAMVAAMCADGPDCGPSAQVVGIAAGIGAAIGASIDALIHRDRTADPRASGPRATLMPAIGHRMRGAVVSVAW